MTPEEIVECIPFHYITDALTPEEALAILRATKVRKHERERQTSLKIGYPAYTTSAGWIGYSDDKVRTLVRAGLDEGWTHFKMKVGRNLEEDLRRAQLFAKKLVGIGS